MDANLKKFFAEQYRKPGNDVCFDCSQPDPSWASTTFGIYLCQVCAGRHRSLGTHVSFVRSCLMDTWKDEHLKVMEFVGNSLFANFLEQHMGSDWESKFKKMPIQERYDQPILEKFKKELRLAVIAETVKHSSPAGLSPENGSVCKSPLGGDGNSKSAVSSLVSNGTSSISPSTNSPSANFPQPNANPAHPDGAVNSEVPTKREAPAAKCNAMWDDDFWD